LDKEAGRPAAESTQLQLAGLWMRERQYERARRAYHDIVVANARSVDGWRGYVTALHDSGDDRTLVSEAVRIPADTRASMLENTGLLSLLAAAHAKAERHEDAVALFRQLRARDRSTATPPPAALDVQFGWELLAAPGHETELKNLLNEAGARTDL